MRRTNNKHKANTPDVINYILFANFSASSLFLAKKKRQHNVRLRLYVVFYLKQNILII